MIKVSTVAALVAMSSPVVAGEFVVSAGNSKFHFSTPFYSTVFSAELHSEPVYQNSRFSARLMGVISAHSDGAGFLGLGVSGRWELKNNWFAEASVAPGLYNASGLPTSLGSNFEIRSLIGVGRKLKNGNRLSLAISHKSNAGTASINPGVNALSIRYNHAF